MRIVLIALGTIWLCVTLSCLLGAMIYNEAGQPLGALCDGGLAIFALMVALLCMSKAWYFK